MSSLRLMLLHQRQSHLPDHQQEILQVGCSTVGLVFSRRFWKLKLFNHWSNLTERPPTEKKYEQYPVRHLYSIIIFVGFFFVSRGTRYYWFLSKLILLTSVLWTKWATLFKRCLLFSFSLLVFTKKMYHLKEFTEVKSPPALLRTKTVWSVQSEDINSDCAIL